MYHRYVCGSNKAIIHSFIHSRQTIESWKEKQLVRKTDTKIKDYNGNEIPVLGQIHLKVEYEGQQKNMCNRVRRCY